MMKYVNLIKLLSVLLCAMILLTACAAPAEEPQPTEKQSETEAATEPQEPPKKPAVPETPLLDKVDPVMKNFFSVGSLSSWRTLGKATRLDGELVDSSNDGSILVFRTAKIDHLNNMTETFTVYNAVLQKTVKTVSNTYPYGYYNELVWGDYYMYDPELRFPEKVVDIAVEEYYEIPYLVVRQAKITPIDEKVFEENEGNSHVVETNFDYYDIAGNHIVSSPTEIYWHGYFDVVGDSVAMNFGIVNATFDLDSREMISKVDADNKTVRYSYDTETEEYGFYLDLTQESALGAEEKFFEVYDKKDGTLVLRYYLDPAKGQGDVFAMAGGDVLVQYAKYIDGDSNEEYNFKFLDEKYMVESYLVDLPTGIAQPVELDYIIETVMNAEDFAEYYDIEDRGIALTENAANIAFAIKMDKEHVDYNNLIELLVLNNDGSVMFKMDRIIPEHDLADAWLGLNPFGYVQLEGGNYLVNIVDNITDRAIVSAEGEVRAYLRPDARVVGKYVVLGGVIYDYDMKPVYDFAADGYTLVNTIGNNIIVSKTEEILDEEGIPTEIIVKYYELNPSGESFDTSSVFDGREVNIIVSEDDYLIVSDKKNGKYVLYNAKLEHILTTENEMDVYLCEDNYMVQTQLVVDGEPIDILYTIE